MAGIALLTGILEKGTVALEALSSGLKVRTDRSGLHAPLTRRERIVYRKLRGLLSGSDLVVFDIGSSGGTYASVFAKAAAVSTVVAFEPIPEVFQTLVQRVAPWPRVTCHYVAVGDVNETAVFHRNAYAYADASSLLPVNELTKRLLPFAATSEPTTVRVVRLDDFVAAERLPPPDVVKIDVQGFEDRVLRGGAATIRHAAVLLIEMSLVPLYDGSLVFDELYQMVKQMGFRFDGFTDQVTDPSGRPLQVDAVFRRDSA